MDVLERCKIRVEDSDREALSSAIAEIENLRRVISRRGHLLRRILNSEDTTLGGNLAECVGDEIQKSP